MLGLHRPLAPCRFNDDSASFSDDLILSVLLIGERRRLCFDL